MIRKKIFTFAPFVFAAVLTACSSGASLASADNESTAVVNVTSSEKLGAGASTGEAQKSEVVQADEGRSTNDQKVTIETHTAEASFSTLITSDGTYPQLILTEKYSAKYPELAHSISELNEKIKREVTEDIVSFGNGNENDGSSYHTETTIRILRFDDAVLTVFRESSGSYNKEGGSDSGRREYISYDVKTGKELNCDDFITDKEGLDSLLYDELIRAYPDSKELTGDKNADGQSLAMANLGSLLEYSNLNCYVQGQDVCFFFDKYFMF